MEIRTMKRTLLVALSVAWLLPAATYAAPDAKLIDSCNDCHGDKGVSIAQDVPTIAGISAGVHSDALKAFKSKSRPCTKVSYKRGDTKRQGDMCTVAGKLSDADMTALADYYGKLPFVPMKQTTDAAKAAAGKTIHERDCKSCHSKGGRDPADEASILGGQPVGWMKATLADLKADKAEQPKKMKEKMGKLSDADLEALAQFYGSEH
jgi:sulfide dehydrogenase cytochrome subunit